jgi:hypothetical protein
MQVSLCDLIYICAEGLLHFEICFLNFELSYCLSGVGVYGQCQVSSYKLQDVNGLEACGSELTLEVLVG